MSPGADSIQARRQRVIDSAAALFTATYGTPPQVFGVAPGRVNLIGDHTDYSGGYCLPLSADRWTAIAMSRADAGPSRFVSDIDAAAVADIDLAKYWSPAEAPVAAAPWVLYPAGVVIEVCRHAGHPLPTVHAAVASDIPIRGGLASSAALEVATARAAASLGGLSMSGAEAARLCQRAEADHARVPCGIMDQYAAALGEEGVCLLIDCRDATHELIPVPRDVDAMGILVDTRAKRSLTDGEYAERRARCEAGCAALGVRSPRDLTEERLLAARSRLEDPHFRALRHAVRENRRVLQVAGLLRDAAHAQVDDWEPVLEHIGVLMVQSHRSLRDDLDVSCPELECVVDAALDGDGVYGARLTGAGLGGCALVLADPAWAQQVAARIEAAFRRRFDHECVVGTFRSVDGAWVTHPGQ